MSPSKTIKLQFEIELTRVDGPPQDEDEVVSILAEEIESMVDLFVQDSEHDKESQYTISKVVSLKSVDEV